MRDLLQALKAAAAERSPKAVENLNPHATAEALQQLTHCFAEAPTDLLQLLALHDGEGSGTSMVGLLPNYMELLSIERILEVHGWNVAANNEFMNDLASLGVADERAKPVFSYSRRIPFACCNGDVYWYVDLDPAPTGQIGQIVHDDAECMVLRVIAGSLQQLLQHYLDDIKQGKFSVEEDGQLISDADWPSATL